jgi:hypothetical protein
MPGLNCNVTVEQVNEAFLKAPPLITSTIKDKSITHPNFMADLPDYREFPLGSGTTMTEIIFKDTLPDFEIGLGKWRKMEGEAGCSDCPGPDCSYNTTVLGGHAFETRLMGMMSRDFRSQDYCIKQIQTTYQYEDVFEKVVQGLYKKVDFYKEFNIAQNILNMLSKKVVVDSGGFKFNKADIYSFPNLGTAVLSTLNIHLVRRLYGWMRRMSDVEPYDIIDNKPLYAVSGSDEIFTDMFRDDADLRQDIRFSGDANSWNKYNIANSIQGMFMIVSDLYPPRYKKDSANEVVQIAPWVNGIPAEIGSFSANNPEYEDAPYEGIRFHGKSPFALYYMPTASTLGQNTSFGPEFSWFDNWMWVNPLTKEDPFRRSGYFVTSATLGVGAQHSEGMFLLLVPRTNLNNLWTQGKSAACYVAPPDCSSNQIPATSCPCPQVVTVLANPLNAGRIYIQFAVPVVGTQGGTIVFNTTNGGTISGTISAISSDGYIVDVDFGASFVAAQCNQFTSYSCVDLRVCSAQVLAGGDCRSLEIGSVKVVTDAPLKVDVNDTVKAYFCDGTSVNMTIKVIDGVNNTYNLAYAAGAGPTDNPTGLVLGNVNGTGYFANIDGFCCDRGLPTSICVPTASEATCPACAAKGPTITQCS